MLRTLKFKKQTLGSKFKGILILIIFCLLQIGLICPNI